MLILCPTPLGDYGCSEHPDGIARYSESFPHAAIVLVDSLALLFDPTYLNRLKGREAAFIDGPSRVMQIHWPAALFPARRPKNVESPSDKPEL